MKLLVYLVMLSSRFMYKCEVYHLGENLLDLPVRPEVLFDVKNDEISFKRFLNSGISRM